MQIVAIPGQVVRPKLPHHADPALTWRQLLKSAIRDPAELCRRLDLPAECITPAQRAAATFPLFVPEPYLSRIRPGDPSDPLLRQVLPLDAELDEIPGYTADPVDDAAAQITEGLLQKYAGRALLITTGACAVHCRYCFRRHFPYSEAPKGLEAWAPALAAIAADESLDEVILSGGDPLTLADSFLAELIQRIASINHIRRIRVHTRLPIVIPQRVTPELINALRQTRLAPIVVVHANHAQEIDSEVANAFAQLIDAGIPLLNQAVLLRGVNDNIEALTELSQKLVNNRVMPYYLHQLDPVQGAAHFHVLEETGLALIAQLQSRLPGYAVPRYVRETPGQASKTIVTP
jgi:EF-P beta-lysylation protein EpmB